MADYDVGFGKPPKKFRFKKGQSGNPNGRPKGKKNLATIIDQVCRERVRVRGENGSYYYISKLEAIMTQLTNAAAKGDIKAAKMCFDVLKMFPHFTEPIYEAPMYHIHFVDAEDGRPIQRKEE